MFHFSLDSDAFGERKWSNRDIREQGSALRKSPPNLKTLEKRDLMMWIDREVVKDWEISAMGRAIFRGMSEGDHQHWPSTLRDDGIIR